MKEKVYERLISFGYPIQKVTDEGGEPIYTPDPADEFMIQFIAEKAITQVKGECNTDTVPDELTNRVVDNIVGEFLLSKKNLGQLVLDDIDFTDSVKSIQEGDTNVTMQDGSSPADMLDCLLSSLMKPIDFADYRKVRW